MRVWSLPVAVRLLAAAGMAAAGVALVWAGEPLDAAGAKAGGRPGLFVSGPLANADGRSLSGARAGAEILATNPGGVADILVSVDGRRVAAHHSRCRPSCPKVARFRFSYKRDRFGPGTHRVTVEAVDESRGSQRRTITVLPPPAAPAGHSPNPQPAFYITARSAGDLRRQAADDAARFARSQGKGRALLVLDFGAPRHQGKRWGVSLRGGKFFTDAQVQSALQAAAQAYHQQYRRGEVTIVYAISNAHLGDPGHGYRSFDARAARVAGGRQMKLVDGVHLYPHESVAVGGDIEPGYDTVAPVGVSLALVSGAAAGAMPYYDVGTAPCEGSNCTNGWTIDDICQVASGSGRHALPEIYYTDSIDQPAQWSAVQHRCGIRTFPGVSAMQGAQLTPGQSWQTLGQRTGADVGEAIVVFPR